MREGNLTVGDLDNMAEGFPRPVEMVSLVGQSKLISACQLHFYLKGDLREEKKERKKKKEKKAYRYPRQGT